VARSLLTLLVVALPAVLSAAGERGGTPSEFPVRMIKIGGRFDRPEVREHLEFCAGRGFNAVWVFAEQAGDWTESRAPDGPRLLPSFLELTEWCRERRFRIFVSLDPVAAAGGEYVFSDPGHARRIEEFFGLLRRAGVRDFVLSFGDEPTVLTALADVVRYAGSSAPAHIDLAQTLERSLRRKESFWLCGATYCDAHLGDGTEPYAREFLEGLSRLPRRVGIVWTGPDVVSPSITSEGLAATRERLGGRKILLYDNYPANRNHDGLALALILGPVRERDPDLGSEVAAYLSSPMRELGASRLALWTVADYLAAPAAYDPDSSWRVAMRHFAGEDAAALDALETQGIEWGGWVSTRNYRDRDADSVFTAADALRDPAALALWTYVVRRYPERLAALRGLTDPAFRDPLVERMGARLAVGRALPLLVELHAAPPEGRQEVWARIDGIRRETAENREAARLLDRFLEAGGVRIPATGPAEIVP